METIPCKVFHYSSCALKPYFPAANGRSLSVPLFGDLKKGYNGTHLGPIIRERQAHEHENGYKKPVPPPVFAYSIKNDFL
jgi:hypothetical protein